MQHSGSQPVKTKRTKQPKKAYKVRKYKESTSAKKKREQAENDLLLDQTTNTNEH